MARSIYYGSAMLFILLVSTGVNAQHYFQKTYNLAELDQAVALTALPNGDLVLAGFSGANAISKRIWAMRVDPDGKPVWSKTYDLGMSSSATAITFGQDGNLLIAYVRFGVSPNDKESGWMKINSDGDVLWTKDGIGLSELLRVHPAQGGGYYLCGQNITAGSGALTGLVVRIKEDGDVLWSSVFGENGNSSVLDCWEDALGFVYCTGYTSELGAKKNGFWAKLGSNGSLVGPVQRFGSDETDELTRIVPMGSDRLLMSGYSDGFGDAGVWTVVTNYSGVLQSSRLFHLTGQNLSTNDLIALPGNQFLLAAGNLVAANTHGVLIKWSLDLDQLFANEYKGGGNQDAFLQAWSSPEGYTAAGGGYENGNGYAYLARTDTEGNLNNQDCCPAPLNITRQSVQPQTAAFVPSQTAFFAVQSTLVTGEDKSISTLDVCRPIALEFSLSKDTICPGDCVEITHADSTAGVNYHFEVLGGTADADHPNRFCHNGAQAFIITRVGDNGACSQSLNKSVAQGSREDQFPTAFTPNGDGSNDIFRPVFYCRPVSMTLEVYDRWGGRVFDTFEVDGGWDGTIYGIPATSDVYVWKLDYTLENNGNRIEKHKKGQVSLLR